MGGFWGALGHCGDGFWKTVRDVITSSNCLLDCVRGASLLGDFTRPGSGSPKASLSSFIGGNLFPSKSSLSASMTSCNFADEEADGGIVLHMVLDSCQNKDA